MSNWQPYCFKKDFHKDTPVCASCKRTNRTRKFCREKHKHKKLPWCTVYVILSAVDSIDPSTMMAAPSKLSSSNNSCDEPNDEGEKDPENEDTDDIHQIEFSRTFLAQVSITKNTIHWLDFMEGEAAPTSTEGEVKALNYAIRSPPMMQPYAGMHHASIPPPPPPYYPMMTPEQQQHYFQHHTAWQAQFAVPPPPMMVAIPPMMPPPPQLPPLPPMMTNESQVKGEDTENNKEGQDTNSGEIKNDYHSMPQMSVSL